jgi:hypothetical protein
MIAAIKSIYIGLKNIWQQGYGYVWANLAFVILSLPIVTAPAAYRALMHVGYIGHTRKYSADIGDFWEAFRADLWRTLPWGVAHAAFAIVNFSNLVSHTATGGGILLRAVWLLATFVWLGVVLFTWTLYDEMETPSVWGATVNATVLVMRNPLFALTIVTFIVLVIWLSTFFMATWMVLTWGIIAAVSNAAVLNRLDVFRGS